jgi:hypothetical protein
MLVVGDFWVAFKSVYVELLASEGFEGIEIG